MSNRATAALVVAALFAMTALEGLKERLYPHSPEARAYLSQGLAK